MVQAAAASRSHGLANCARNAPGSTRRKARHSSRKTVSGKNGRISAPSGGSAIPSRMEIATALVPWRPSQASAAAGRSRNPHGMLRHNSRAGGRRVRRLHMAVERQSRNPLHGPNRCDRAGRRHRRHLGGAASRQARARGRAGGPPRAGRGNVLRQRRRDRGQYALPARLPVRLRRVPADRAQAGARGQLSSVVPAEGRALAAGLSVQHRAPKAAWRLPRRCGRCSRAR